MSDFDFITQIQGDPIALTVLGGVVLIKIIEYLIKFAPRLFSYLFSKEKKLPFWKWQNYVSKEINEIKTNIEKLFSAVSLHEQFSNKISEGTLTNQLFSDELWLFLRLKAFRCLLAMGKNGRIWEKGFSLALDHKEDWLNVLDTELGVNISDTEYYQSRLDYIRKHIDNFAKE